MTDSFTHCLKKRRAELWRWLALVLACGWALAAWGQTAGEIQQLRVERVDDDVVLSAQMQFELPASVEEVLTKGIPLTFTAEADLYRERWYWFDKRQASAQRSYRLVYQPLSRRWRITTAGSVANGAALSANQSFDSLSEAMGALKRIARWRIAEGVVLEPGVRYKVDFRYRLDVSQLALPLQIGTLGQSDWNVTLSASAVLTADNLR